MKSCQCVTESQIKTINNSRHRSTQLCITGNAYSTFNSRVVQLQTPQYNIVQKKWYVKNESHLH